MTHLQIFVFGDSITYGAWDPEGGWVARLRKYLDKKQLAEPKQFYYMVYNLGVSGDSSEDVLERFSTEIEQRFEKDVEALVIFAIGINDAHFFKNVAQAKVVEKFNVNLKKLTALAHEYTRNILFVGATPVIESKTMPVPWNVAISYDNKQISKDDKLVREFCKKKNIPFIEVFEDWQTTKYELLLSHDGLHPNSEGHEKIAEAVKKYLEQRKRA